MTLDKDLYTVQVYIYMHVLRRRSLTVEREGRKTVPVLTICQILIKPTMQSCVKGVTFT